MNIELPELVNLIKSTGSQIAIGSTYIGQHIVVLDRGFVYVGDVQEMPDRILIEDCKNVRYWGTKNGLGELVNGPLTGTKLDSVGSVIVYRHAIIHMIKCKGF